MKGYVIGSVIGGILGISLVAGIDNARGMGTEANTTDSHISNVEAHATPYGEARKHFLHRIGPVTELFNTGHSRDYTMYRKGYVFRVWYQRSRPADNPAHFPMVGARRVEQWSVLDCRVPSSCVLVAHFDPSMLP